jgi:RNA polymerase sigma factor (sigma-70 family)
MREPITRTSTKGPNDAVPSGVHALSVEMDTEEATVQRPQPIAPSFEEYFRGEYGRLVRALVLLLGEAGEAEEVAQEAMVRVYERWDRVATMESPEGYLYRTALNLHRKTRRRLAVRTRLTPIGPPARDPIERADDRLMIRLAVAGLPRAQREALVLVEWVGLDAAAAGRVLGIEAASVRGRLHRARQLLIERLGGPDDA